MDDAERAAVLEALARERLGFDPSVLDQQPLTAHRRSPTCGDDVTVRLDLDLDDSTVLELSWRGHGCVISQAAASALAGAAPGLDVRAFRALASDYLASVQPDGAPVDVGELAVFAGVGRFPLRAGCATLAWRAALDALADLDS